MHVNEVFAPSISVPKSELLHYKTLICNVGHISWNHHTLRFYFISYPIKGLHNQTAVTCYMLY